MATSPKVVQIVPRYGEYSEDEKNLFHQRLNDLKSAYRIFHAAKIRDRAKEWPFELNESLLITICLLYLNDLKEFKVFHDVDKGTDHLKRGAYLSRWVSNMRPIQFEPECRKVNNPDLLHLNEEFAIFVFFLYIGVDENALEMPIIQSLTADLKYIFKFRDPQRELLVSLARVTESAIMAAKGTQVSRRTGTDA